MEDHTDKFIDMLAVRDSHTNFVPGGPPACNKLTTIERIGYVGIRKDQVLTGREVDFTSIYDPSATAVYVQAGPEVSGLRGSTYLHFRLHSEVRV